MDMGKRKKINGLIGYAQNVVGLWESNIYQDNIIRVNVISALSADRLSGGKIKICIIGLLRQGDMSH